MMLEAKAASRATPIVTSCDASTGVVALQCLSTMDDALVMYYFALLISACLNPLK